MGPSDNLFCIHPIITGGPFLGNKSFINNLKFITMKTKNVKKIIEYIMYGILIILLFGAGFCAGMGDWIQALNTISFIVMACLAFYYRKMWEKVNNMLGKTSLLLLENKILKMHEKYYEDKFGKIADIEEKEHGCGCGKTKDDCEHHADNDAPGSSAEANEETEMGHMAEGVGED